MLDKAICIKLILSQIKNDEIRKIRFVFVINLNLNQKKIMNKDDILIVFVLSQGAGKARKNE